MGILAEGIAEARHQLSHELAEVAERLRQSTVQIRGVRGQDPGGGSGVIWQGDGLIVTNAHVARGRRARVGLWDGRWLDAVVKARDSERDVAALAVDARSLPAAEIGDSSALRAGELVLAVGNPLGLVGALSTGIISAVTVGGGFEGGPRGRGWIQADLRLAPGNSGGPLADARGRVVGINSMVAGGLALAVPSNAVADFVGRGQGAALPLRLGVTIAPVLVPENGGRVFGLLVLEVEPAGPAEVAGLMVGDVLVGADGKPLEGPYDLARALSHAGQAGGTAGYPVELIRAGRRLTCEVFLSQAMVESMQG